MSIKVDNQTIYKAYYGTTPIVNYIGTSSDFVKWQNGWKMGYSNITDIPQNIDFSDVTDWEYMFNSCTQLKNVDFTFPSGCTDTDYLFNSCSSLETFNGTFEGKLTSCQRMFNGCSSLTTIPNFDTSNVTNMSYMFYRCSSLTAIPLLDCGMVTNIGYFFGSSNITTLTDLGGFKNLKINWSDTNGLYRCPNLTYQSVLNVINNLYDFRTNGDTTTTRTIKFSSNSIALLSDEDIAIGTAKGWNITA